MRIERLATVALVLVLAALCSPADSQSLTVRSASGASPAAIQATVDQFRADLGGANNGVGALAGTGGRREVNWDAVPNGFAAPNTLPGGFFNQNSQRGLVTTAVSPATGFMVSDAASGGNGVGVRFDNLNPSYSAQFQTFSPQKLFTSLGGNAFDVTFFVPLTGPAVPGSTPAVVSGFGMVITDADAAGTSFLQFFDRNNVSLGAFAFPPAASGLSFMGAFVNGLEPSIARVRVSMGNSAIGPNDGGNVDVVVMDDFIYGEPLALLLRNGFE